MSRHNVSVPDTQSFDDYEKLTHTCIFNHFELYFQQDTCPRLPVLRQKSVDETQQHSYCL